MGLGSSRTLEPARGKKITHNRYVKSLEERIASFDTFIQEFKLENQTGKNLAKLIVNI